MLWTIFHTPEVVANTESLMDGFFKMLFELMFTIIAYFTLA